MSENQQANGEIKLDKKKRRNTGINLASDFAVSVTPNFEIRKSMEVKSEKPSKIKRNKTKQEPEQEIEMKEEKIENDSSDEDNGNEQKVRLSTREIQNYHLLSFILTIRASVSIHSKIEKFEITPADFKDVSSFYIMPIGAPDKLLVREYAGFVFEEFRRKLSVTTERYLWSWSHSSLKDPSRTHGKSDSSFIYSYDNRFLIKTLSHEESKWLRKILPNYYEYLKENENSLLTRFLGLYRLTDGNRIVYFTVIPNIFQSKQMSEIYDLKGSTVSRARKSDNPSAPLLDRDIKRKFIFGKEKKEKFMSILKNDSKFLSDNNLMDYSLLVGVCTNSQSNNFPHPKNQTRTPGMVCFLEEERKIEEEEIIKEPLSASDPALKPCIKRSRRRDSFPTLKSESSSNIINQESFILNNEQQKEEVYYIGIIDYLQKYNSKKKFYGFAKSLKHDKDGLSTVAPGFYSRRFVEFIDSLLE